MRVTTFRSTRSSGPRCLRGARPSSASSALRSRRRVPVHSRRAGARRGETLGRASSIHVSDPALHHGESLGTALVARSSRRCRCSRRRAGTRRRGRGARAPSSSMRAPQAALAGEPSENDDRPEPERPRRLDRARTSCFYRLPPEMPRHTPWSVSSVIERYLPQGGLQTAEADIVTPLLSVARGKRDRTANLRQRRGRSISRPPAKPRPSILAPLSKRLPGRHRRASVPERRGRRRHRPTTYRLGCPPERQPMILGTRPAASEGRLPEMTLEVVHATTAVSPREGDPLLPFRPTPRPRRPGTVWPRDDPRRRRASPCPPPKSVRDHRSTRDHVWREAAPARRLRSAPCDHILRRDDAERIPRRPSTALA